MSSTSKKSDTTQPTYDQFITDTFISSYPGGHVNIRGEYDINESTCTSSTLGNDTITTPDKIGPINDDFIYVPSPEQPLLVPRERHNVVNSTYTNPAWENINLLYYSSHADIDAMNNNIKGNITRNSINDENISTNIDSLHNNNDSTPTPPTHHHTHINTNNKLNLNILNASTYTPDLTNKSTNPIYSTPQHLQFQPPIISNQPYPTQIIPKQFNSEVLRDQTKTFDILGNLFVVVEIVLFTLWLVSIAALFFLVYLHMYHPDEDIHDHLKDWPILLLFIYILALLSILLPAITLLLRCSIVFSCCLDPQSILLLLYSPKLITIVRRSCFAGLGLSTFDKTPQTLHKFTQAIAKFNKNTIPHYQYTITCYGVSERVLDDTSSSLRSALKASLSSSEEHNTRLSSIEGGTQTQTPSKKHLKTRIFTLNLPLISQYADISPPYDQLNQAIEQYGKDIVMCKRKVAIETAPQNIENLLKVDLLLSNHYKLALQCDRVEVERHLLLLEPKTPIFGDENQSIGSQHDTNQTPLLTPLLTPADKVGLNELASPFHQHGRTKSFLSKKTFFNSLDMSSTELHQTSSHPVYDPGLLPHLALPQLDMTKFNILYTSSKRKTLDTTIINTPSLQTSIPYHGKYSLTGRTKQPKVSYCCGRVLHNPILGCCFASFPCCLMLFAHFVTSAFNISPFKYTHTKYINFDFSAFLPFDFLQQQLDLTTVNDLNNDINQGDINIDHMNTGSSKSETRFKQLITSISQTNPYSSLELIKSLSSHVSDRQPITTLHSQSSKNPNPDSPPSRLSLFNSSSNIDTIPSSPNNDTSYISSSNTRSSSPWNNNNNDSNQLYNELFDIHNSIKNGYFNQQTTHLYNASNCYYNTNIDIENNTNVTHDNIVNDHSNDDNTQINILTAFQPSNPQILENMSSYYNNAFTIIPVDGLSQSDDKNVQVNNNETLSHKVLHQTNTQKIDQNQLLQISPINTRKRFVLTSVPESTFLSSVRDFIITPRQTAQPTSISSDSIERNPSFLPITTPHSQTFFLPTLATSFDQDELTQFAQYNPRAFDVLYPKCFCCKRPALCNFVFFKQLFSFRTTLPAFFMAISLYYLFTHTTNPDYTIIWAIWDKVKPFTLPYILYVYYQLPANGYLPGLYAKYWSKTEVAIVENPFHYPTLAAHRGFNYDTDGKFAVMYQEIDNQQSTHQQDNDTVLASSQSLLSKNLPPSSSFSSTPSPLPTDFDVSLNAWTSTNNILRRIKQMDHSAPQLLLKIECFHFEMSRELKPLFPFIGAHNLWNKQTSHYEELYIPIIRDIKISPTGNDFVKTTLKSPTHRFIGIQYATEYKLHPLQEDILNKWIDILKKYYSRYDMYCTVTVDYTVIPDTTATPATLLSTPTTPLSATSTTTNQSCSGQSKPDTKVHENNMNIDEIRITVPAVTNNGNDNDGDHALLLDEPRSNLSNLESDIIITEHIIDHSHSNNHTPSFLWDDFISRGYYNNIDDNPSLSPSSHSIYHNHPNLIPGCPVPPYNIQPHIVPMPKITLDDRTSLEYVVDTIFQIDHTTKKKNKDNMAKSNQDNDDWTLLSSSPLSNKTSKTMSTSVLKTPSLKSPNHQFKYTLPKSPLQHNNESSNYQQHYYYVNAAAHEHTHNYPWDTLNFDHWYINNTTYEGQNDNFVWKYCCAPLRMLCCCGGPCGDLFLKLLTAIIIQSRYIYHLCIILYLSVIPYMLWIINSIVVKYVDIRYIHIAKPSHPILDHWYQQHQFPSLQHSPNYSIANSMSTKIRPFYKQHRNYFSRQKK